MYIKKEVEIKLFSQQITQKRSYDLTNILSTLSCNGRTVFRGACFWPLWYWPGREQLKQKNSIEAISSISFSVTRLTLKDFELQQEKNRVADPERFCYGSGSRSGSKFSESRILSRIQIRFLIRHFFFDNLKLWKNLTCWCFAPNISTNCQFWRFPLLFITAKHLKV